MKICSCCKQSKPATNEFFYKYKTRGNSLTAKCKECILAQQKGRYNRNPEKYRKYRKEYFEKNKENVANKAYFQSVLTKYSLTQKDYETLWEKQAGRCKICDKAFKDIKRPSVDHCHDTGRVRGLLCKQCNTGIGQFKDNPDLLLLACDYLLDFQELSEEMDEEGNRF